MLANWEVLQLVGNDGIVESSKNWEVSVFNRGIKLFSLLKIPYKLSVITSVDMFKTERYFLVVMR